MASDDSMKMILVLGAAGVGLWYLYEQGYLYQWTGIASLAPSTVPVSTTTPGVVPTPVVASTPAPTSTAVPVVSQPAPATPFQVIGSATPNINGSVSANVSINGGAPENISIIISNGQAYDTSGHGINSALASAGVNIPALLTAMLASCGAACSGGVSGLGMFAGGRVPMEGIHGMGYGRVRRGWVV